MVASPWEHPTTVSPGRFIVDIAVALAALMAVLALVVLAFQQARTPRRGPAASD